MSSLVNSRPHAGDFFVNSLKNRLNKGSVIYLNEPKGHGKLNHASIDQYNGMIKQKRMRRVGLQGLLCFA